MANSSDSQKINTAPKWCVYILRCSDDSLYTGISNDPEARVQKHNLGLGAKYTRSRLPVRMVYSETVPDKSQALKREHALKKLKREEKEKLIFTHPCGS